MALQNTETNSIKQAGIRRSSYLKRHLCERFFNLLQKCPILTILNHIYKEEIVIIVFMSKQSICYVKECELLIEDRASLACWRRPRSRYPVPGAK